jgi:CRP/FNR family transcriptional regulator
MWIKRLLFFWRFSVSSVPTGQSALGILSSSPFFRGLNKDSLQKVGAMARLARYKKGRTIFRQGDPCPGVFVMGEGLVRIFKTAPSGKEHVLHLVSAGMTFAEVAAIGRFPCPAHAQALQDTVCALLPMQPFLRALESDRDLCLQLMGSMAAWVRQLTGLLEDIVLRDATGRIAQYLLRSDADSGGEPSCFKLPALKKDLASHLNLTSETLSRTFRRLADCNLIEMPDAQHVRIVDRRALADVARGILPQEFE